MLSSNALNSTLAQIAGDAGWLVQFGPIVLMFVVLYFLMIRPQMKRQKEHRNMLDALAKGDEVTTNGGLLGRVIKVSDTHVTLDIARDNEHPVEVVVQKMAVGSVLPKGTIKSL